MEDKKGAKERLDAFTDFLRREERSKSTVEKYSREISLFLQWLDGRSIDQEQVIQSKHHLMEMDYTPSTIKGMLVALNRFLVFIGHPECKVATLKLQRRLFREEKGAAAYTVVESDEKIPEDIPEKIKENPLVSDIMLVQL